MSFDQKQQVRVHIRWMIRRDMPEVLAIEAESFEFPWPKGEFVRCLRGRNVVCIVVEIEDKVVGYMIYELHKKRIVLLNFAIAEDRRRRGIGTQMMDRIKRKLSFQRRSSVSAEVRERNLDGQLFLKVNGFRAVSVLKDNYEETDEDAYLMQHRFKFANQSDVDFQFSGKGDNAAYL